MTRVLVALVVLGFVGCATLISGTHQEMSFTSAPNEATVMVEGRVLGKTPITVSMAKDSGKSVVFQKDGFKDATLPMPSGLDNWFWGNILLGGLIGSTVDAASGAVHQYEQSSYMATLEPAGTTPIEGKVVMPEKQKAKEFIVVAYPQIMKDLGARSGQYLDSLYEMLKVPPEQRTEAAKKIEALASVYPTIPEFADRVIELYLK